MHFISRHGAIRFRLALSSFFVRRPFRRHRFNDWKKPVRLLRDKVETRRRTRG